MQMEPPIVAVLGGVAGAGKTTVGSLFASRHGWEFVDGDDLHPPRNRGKMASRKPLTDNDRWPWLRKIRLVIEGRLKTHSQCIVECSALKQSYRRFLMDNLERVQILLLVVDYETACQRNNQRRGHFFPIDLLRSQFNDLELPSESQCIDGKGSIDNVIAQLEQHLLWSRDNF